MPQPPRQLRFDSVLVAPPGTREYSRPASDGTVQYTSREVAADLGRRCLKLRDVARVSYGDNDGSPPALEVRGKGKCSSLRCSLGRNVDGEGRREFLSFAEDLMAAHRKALKKAGLPDPYGGNDGSKTTTKTAGRGGIGGKKSAALKARGIRSTLPGRAHRADVPPSSASTAQQRTGGVFLTSPARDARRTYASPARQLSGGPGRRRGASPRGGLSQSSSTSPEEESAAVVVVSGNVLRESPNNKRGSDFLPSKSPRNASPAKSRSASRSRTTEDVDENSPGRNADNSPGRSADIHGEADGGKPKDVKEKKRERGIQSFFAAKKKDEVEDPSDEYETDDQRGSSQDTAASRRVGASEEADEDEAPNNDEAPSRPSLKERFDRVADLDDDDGRDEEGSDDIFDQVNAPSAGQSAKKRPREEAAVVSVKKSGGGGSGDKIRLTTVNTFRATGQLVSARKSPGGGGRHSPPGSGTAVQPRKTTVADSALAASPDTEAKGKMKGLMMSFLTKDKKEKVEPTGQGPGLFGNAPPSTPVKGPFNSPSSVRSPLGVRAPRSARPPSRARKVRIEVNEFIRSG